MKIIQSFAKLNVGNVYLDKLNKYDNDFKIGSETYLLFYSFLLSYLTLKKYCGSVTMYCNRDAYESFIKYIPYDEIILKENKYDSLKFWSVYKIDVIEEQTEDFIHVDSDVFIFEDLFKPFINNSKIDMIVQQYVDISDKKILYSDANLPKNYDFRSVGGGVVGLRKNLIPKFIQKTKKTINDIKENKLSGDNLELGIKIEELNLYLMALEENLKIYDVMFNPNVKYTHLVLETKFNSEYIKLIKKNIFNNFNEYYYLIDNYEKMLKKYKK